MLIPIAVAAAGGAMVLVRIGWGRAGWLALGGWAARLAALLVLTREAGAWGLATGSIAGMACALAAVLHAGWAEPARGRRAAREAPSIILPRAPRDIARRIAVFVLVVPVAFAAASWLAFAVQALARSHGAGDADAVAMTLFLQPVLWSMLMTWQMIRPGPRQMIAAPAAAAVIGAVLWSLA